MSNESKKCLFCIRIHPASESHTIIALFATSASEAEIIAREKTGFSYAPISVFECSDEDAIIVSFPTVPTSKAVP